MHSRHDTEEATGRELYGKVAPWVVIVLVLLGGWLARGPLVERFVVTTGKAGPGGLPSLGLAPPAPLVASPEAPFAGDQAGAASARKDTVYRWVDKDGVTHYEQHEGSGREAVEVDQGRIGSLNRYAGQGK